MPVTEPGPFWFLNLEAVPSTFFNIFWNLVARLKFFGHVKALKDLRENTNKCKKIEVNKLLMVGFLKTKYYSENIDLNIWTF